MTSPPPSSARPRAASSGSTRRRWPTSTTSCRPRCASVLLVLPNLPHPEAPDGTSDADNPSCGDRSTCPTSSPTTSGCRTGSRGSTLGILDNERAIKISGAMFAMTRGLGATLGRALCQLALDRNADAFEEIRPPSLVTTATLTATGQLPKFADDAFAIERDDLWCIPTAEVPLTSIYRDEILAEADLPVRLMAYDGVLPTRGRIGRAGHQGHAALTRVRQGRDPRPRHARAEPGVARRDGGAGRGNDRRARPALPHDRDLRRRPRPEPPPQLRHRGVRTRRGPVARGLVGELVLRLPGPPGQHPLTGAVRSTASRARAPRSPTR